MLKMCLVVGVLAGACDDGRKSTKPAEVRPPAPTTVVPPVISAPVTPTIEATTAEERGDNIPVVDVALGVLVADYKTNEVAADDKYKDQVLNLHAAVHRIGKDEHGKPFLDLQIGSSHTFTRALFANEKGLAALKPGADIAAHCFCEGFVGARLVLNSCELQL